MSLRLVSPPGLPPVSTYRLGLVDALQRDRFPYKTSERGFARPRVDFIYQGQRETRVVTSARLRVLLPRALVCALIGGSNRLFQSYSYVLELAGIRRLVGKTRQLKKRVWCLQRRWMPTTANPCPALSINCFKKSLGSKVSVWY